MVQWVKLPLAMPASYAGGAPVLVPSAPLVILLLANEPQKAADNGLRTNQSHQPQGGTVSQ